MPQNQIHIRRRQQHVTCIHYIAGAALQAVMDFFQILVTSGNAEVDFHRLFEVTTVVCEYIY